MSHVSLVPNWVYMIHLSGSGYLFCFWFFVPLGQHLAHRISFPHPYLYKGYQCYKLVGWKEFCKYPLLFLKVCIMPLCLYERPTLVLIFTD